MESKCNEFLAVFEIPFRLPSLNDYIDVCRSSKNAGNKYKTSIEDDIQWFLRKMGKIDEPIFLTFEWHEPNLKRDKDNVCFAKKFILDALQKSGVITNDNNRFVKGFHDFFFYEKGVEKVVVKIRKHKEICA